MVRRRSHLGILLGLLLVAAFNLAPWPLTSRAPLTDGDQCAGFPYPAYRSSGMGAALDGPAALVDLTCACLFVWWIERLTALGPRTWWRQARRWGVAPLDGRRTDVDARSDDHPDPQDRGL